jgi:alpha-tubulin suppressor-like RCC1 family protein
VVGNFVVAELGDDGWLDVYNHNGQTDVVFDVVGFLPADAGYTSVTPTRVLDTRDGTGGISVPVGRRQSVSVPVAGHGGIPADAAVVAINITAVTQPGFLTVWPSGTSRPTVSSINFPAGGVVGNFVLAELGDDGMLDVYNHNGTTDVVFDVVGYVPGGSPALTVAVDEPVGAVAPGGRSTLAVAAQLDGAAGWWGLVGTVGTATAGEWALSAPLTPLDGRQGTVAVVVDVPWEATGPQLAAELEFGVCPLGSSEPLACAGPTVSTQPLTVQVPLAPVAAATPGDGPRLPAASRWVEVEPTVAVLDDELLVALDRTLELDGRDTVAAAVAETAGGVVVGGDRWLGVYQVAFPGGTPADAEALLAGLPAVTEVFDHYGFSDITDQPPNDPQLVWSGPKRAGVWGLEQIGAPAAWDLTTGSEQVKVGIIDLGIRGDHPDLAPNLAAPVRLPYGSQGGWGRGFLQHGTHVAGTACARGDNGIGIAGVAWRCGLYGYDLAAAALTGNDDNAAAHSAFTVAYEMRRAALDDKVDIVNMSLGFPQEPRGTPCRTNSEHRRIAAKVAGLFELAVEVVKEAGADVLWITSAGNNCRTIDHEVPARLALDYDNVLAVAATDSDKTLAPFSNWGPGVVAAPGGIDTTLTGTLTATQYEAITSTLAWTWTTTGTTVSSGTGYGDRWPTYNQHGQPTDTLAAGTSYAAPHVTGVAALTKTMHPDKTATQIATCIRNSTNDRPVTITTPRRTYAGKTSPATPADLTDIGIINAPTATTCNTTEPPPSGGDASDLAADGNHSCARHADGTLSCWGWNQYGQLGDGTTTNRTTPVEVAGIAHATHLAPGGYHTCVLHADATVSCWGYNGYGELGDGTTTNRTTPVKVAGITDASRVAAGEWHTCVLHVDATVSCWGNNWAGQLGDGTTTDRTAPVKVVGITDATDLTANAWHSCARHADGTVSCWGPNWYGQLGDGTTTSRTTPVKVAGITDATQIAAGGEHTCVRHADGAASCWGLNGSGRLGDGTTTDRMAPVKVAGITDAVHLTAGAFHSCVRHADATASCWGYSGEGQLGDGTTTNRTTPVKVAGITDATELAAAFDHSCARHADGTASCWGGNWYGQLGDGTTTNRHTPFKVVGLP